MARDRPKFKPDDVVENLCDFIRDSLLSDVIKKEEDMTHITFQAMEDARTPRKNGLNTQASGAEEMDYESASQLVKELWRPTVIRNEFYSEKGRELYWSMLVGQDNELKCLAQQMFGKATAGIYKDFGIRSKNDPNFNAEQHPAWPLGVSYSGNDDIVSGRAITKLITKFYKNPDLNTNLYLPISNVKGYSIEDLIKEYFSDEMQKNIVAIERLEEGADICVMQVKKGAGTDMIIELVRSSGLVVAPWEVALFNAKYNAELSEPVDDVIEIETDDLESRDTTLPSTIAELKTSDLVVRLAQIAIKSKRKNKLLAACLHRMIKGLPEGDIDPGVVKRASLLLEIAVKCYKKDYERFVFAWYAVMHDVSALLHSEKKKGVNAVDYKSYKSIIERDVISCFGMPIPKESDENGHHYKTIVLPALSGMHTFMSALKLAKSMQTNSAFPSIKVCQPQYGESESFIANYTHSAAGNADIYLLSSGPTVSRDGIVPGVNINNFIRSEILHSGKDLEKPVTLVVDVTTGLHEDFALDNDIKRMVEDGKISIICYESYQKFGLPHAGKTQGGVVYGVCSDKSFKSAMFSEIEECAKADLEEHLDMAVAAFIHENIGEYLEKIKLQHFKNSAVFKDLMQVVGGPVSESDLYDDTISKLNELCFYIAMGDREFLHVALSKIVNRDNFASFSDRSDAASGMTRVSTNVLDKTDTLIQVVQVYMASHYRPKRLLAFVNALIEHVIPNHKSANQMALVGILFALSKNTRLTSIEQIRLLAAIDTLSKVIAPELADRAAYHALMKYLIDHKQTYITYVENGLAIVDIFRRKVSSKLPFGSTAKTCDLKDTELHRELFEVLWLASRRDGDAEIIKTLAGLYEMKRKWLNAYTDDGMTLLTTAIFNGNNAAVEVLLEAGASADVEVKHGALPSTLAAACGNLEALKILEKKGVDLTMKASCNYTPIEAAEHKLKDETKAEIIEYLKAYDEKKKLLQAAGILNVFKIKNYVTAEIDLDVTNKKGESAAYLACACQVDDGGRTLRVLADGGADLNKPTKMGYTPAVIAAYYGHIDNLKVLADHGVDLTARSPFGITPIEAAEEMGHAVTVKYLAEIIEAKNQLAIKRAATGA